jgi:site-specific DNA recombinase
MRAIVYSRVSTDAQERDGTSIETQERASLEFARSQGWTVITCIRDTASGYSLDRPGIERVRGLLRDGSADVVLSYAVDRLSRNQNQIGVLFDEAQSAGARLEFITERFEDTAIGRFILAARAFIAEVEREKIAERTMRGKAERARAGKLPQGTGKGIYGYCYYRQTGRREIDADQAVIVRRVYERYLQLRSFSAVAGELNSENVTAFSGGRWYPLTIRVMLRNESYAGRSVYRRTRRVKVRDKTTGKRRTRVEQRPPQDWIEMVGLTPPIVSRDVWERVQAILDDPERIRRRPTARFYALSGRARCGICGAAMVGQTLTVKGSPYRYYRCRHVYDKNTSRACSARYVRGDELEVAVWAEVKRILSNPAIVLQELERGHGEDGVPDEIEQLERQRASVLDREKRLVRLYSFGEIDDAVVQKECADLRKRRAVIEQRLQALRQVTLPVVQRIDVFGLEHASKAVAEWLEQARRGGANLGLRSSAGASRSDVDECNADWCHSGGGARVYR